MSYKDHALQEFKAAGWLNEDDSFKDGMQERICTDVLGLLAVFDEHGHSGTTAPYAIDIFSKLASFKPLVPLTGADDEWRDVSNMYDSTTDKVFRYQNKRCSHVFKDSDQFDGQAYDSQAIIFFDWHEVPLESHEEGYPGVNRYQSYYTGPKSRVPITFPYTPTTEYRLTPLEDR